MVPSRGVKIQRAKLPKAFWGEVIPWQECQCPGEKQKYWPGPVDCYPNPVI